MNTRRTLFFLALGLFGLYSVEFGVVGILPSIISRYSISVAQAGALVGVFALVVAFFGPITVLFLSRRDRRKTMTFSLLAFSVCSLLSAWAPSFAVLMLLRIPSALLHPLFFSLAFASAVSLYPPGRAAHATAMAFVGTSMGMVLGVPLTTWVETSISYEASFFLCAMINAIAAAGIWLMLPPSADAAPRPGRDQLAIFLKPAMWLSIGMTVCLFGAGFSVYSYAAEYLAHSSGLSARAISVLLIFFGCGGVAGNLIAGRLLGRFRIATVLVYPLSLALAYVVLSMFGSSSFWSMVPICLFWGAAHTSGLVVSQVWLTSAAAEESRQFATSVYLSAANVGVVIGSTAGGAFIALFGLQGAIWSGWILGAMTLAFVAARIWLVAPLAKQCPDLGFGDGVA